MAFEHPVPNATEIGFVVSVLKGTGHYTGPDTTEWTPELEAALRKYQIDKGLSVSGSLDTQTRGQMATDVGMVTGTIGKDPALEFIVEHYGPGMVAFINDPEIGPILRWSAAEKATVQVLQQRIQNTQWYKRQGASQRAWEDKKANDPGEADRLRQQKEAELWDRARTLGVQNVNPALIQNMAEDSLAHGWNPSQEQDILAGFLTYDPKAPEGGGTVSAMVSQLKDYARKYFIVLDDKAAFDMATRIAKGELTLEAAVVTFKQQAKAKFNYGGIDKLIDQGITPEDYFGETRRIIAQNMGIAPEAVDFTTSRFSQALSVADPTTGALRAMTTTEADRWSRRTPEFDGSEQGTSEAASLALNLHQLFTGVR